MGATAAAARESGIYTTHQRGFTLPEILVTILIAGILLSFAIPSYTKFVQNERQTAQLNNLVFSLNYARSEAIKRDSVICLCPYNTNSPPTTEACGTNWAQGWIVHIPDPTQSPIDCTKPNTALTAPLPILQTGGAVSVSSTTLSGQVGSTALTSVSYLASGQANANNAPITAGNTIQFKLCDSRGAKKARDLEVTANGRPQTSSKQGFQIDGTTALTCP